MENTSFQLSIRDSMLALYTIRDKWRSQIIRIDSPWALHLLAAISYHYYSRSTNCRYCNHKTLLWQTRLPFLQINVAFSNFNRWSRSNNLMRALVKKTDNNSDFITPSAAFVKQSVINAVQVGLEQERQVTEGIPSPSDHSLSASAVPR